ncbi:hypothetical protein PTSG_06842 [Salpingoeca rosetta]|uniref:Ion transport domain-containing protein n=1 Tax=Salpingoeca rosetta (strain ATCC 50818 / BSB-021) TaxID=946362 RepID=F2UEY9_SALR5|nr:uncharacterized protein PTSG_06842 [Salpingoeca rosetta]EGD75189.1 hypothetical protein PTSG_06842 [Salpingoeca rosetta]|eukprot:XP_004992242.1 hypothetical protein PTSG_06842 [Salpingoeca rosetta]
MSLELVNGRSRGGGCAASMNRLMYSKAYLVFYLLIALLCLGELIWTIVTQDVTLEYLVVDIILNVLIILELIIRLIAITPARFVKSKWNLVDAFIVLASVVTLILAIVEFSTPGEEEVILAASGSVFVALRCAIQVFRIFLLLRMQWKRRQILGTMDDGDDSDDSQRLMFGDLDEPDAHDFNSFIPPDAQDDHGYLQNMDELL